MFEPRKLLDQLLGAATSAGGIKAGLSPELVKGLAGGAALGGMAGLLLGGRSAGKLAETALKVGGTAALAGLAYKVYRDWQSSRAAAPDAAPPMKDITPKPEGTPFLPAAGEARDAVSLAILRAMIAAAKSDGSIDEAEQQKILARLEALDLDAEGRTWVMDELRKPLDIDAVVAAATSPEIAVEIYTASLLAIDPDDPAEQAYLAMLASRLKLDPGLRSAIEAETRRATA